MSSTQRIESWNRILKCFLRHKLTWSGIEILSPLISVRTLLSSMTEFMDSIQRVSTGPSSKIHFSSGFSSEHAWRITDDSTPSKDKGWKRRYWGGCSGKGEDLETSDPQPNVWHEPMIWQYSVYTRVKRKKVSTHHRSIRWCLNQILHIILPRKGLLDWWGNPVGDDFEKIVENETICMIYPLELNIP